MKLKTKSILIYMMIAFFVFLIWRWPNPMAANAGDFLGAIGNFIVTLLDRVSTFLGGLSDKKT